MCNNNEKMAEDMKVTLDVDTYTDDMVMISRAEYSEMVAECTILRVVEKLARDSKAYSGDVLDTIRAVLELGDEEDAE